MNLSGLLGIGGNWASAIRSTLSVGRTAVSPDAATVATAALGVNTGSTAATSADAIRHAIRTAAGSFRAAFSTFQARSKPVFTTSVEYTGAAARVSGLVARVAAVEDSYAVLRTTAAVNTQTSTVRASSSAIGLDLVTAASILSGTPAFSGVTTGSFTVNGVSIAVDANADSLQDVLARVSASGASVTAAYDAVADVLVFTPSVAGATLALDADTTGLLVAAHVATGVAGTHLNATAAFDARGLDAPLFDPGVSVHAGSFTVNGVAIAVASTDTVTSVLAGITASAAGVTATYDGATQTVSLARTSGTAAITLAGDTSGFLDAVKFNGTEDATTVARTYSAYTTALSDMVEYSTVQSGTLTVNGQQFLVNPATTTIDGLVAALNATANVSAEVNEGSGVITISSRQLGGSLTLADTSGLLSTLGIATGTYAGGAVTSRVVETQSGTTTVTNSNTVAARAAVAVEQLNAALTPGAGPSGPAIAADGASLYDAVDALRDAGIDGLSVDNVSGTLRIVMDAESLSASLAGFSNEASLTSAMKTALDGLAERVGASAETRVLDQEQAKQRLAVEQAQTALLFRAPLRPRAAEGASSSRRAQERSRPRTEDRLVEKREATMVSSATDLLRPIVDLFVDRASAAGAPDRSGSPAAWWRW